MTSPTRLISSDAITILLFVYEEITVLEVCEATVCSFVIIKGVSIEKCSRDARIIGPEYEINIHLSEAEGTESKLLNVYKFLLSLNNSISTDNKNKYEEKYSADNVRRTPR